jgi:uncharacterized protein YdeI (YjbR/CyaY-like superfamily)
MTDELPAPEDGLPQVYAADRAAWRAWLETHGETSAAVWLVYYKKDAGRPSITWSEAVEEALCFGWIDSKAKPIDDLRYRQYFSPRKPKSPWSKINKASVERLIAAGLMREPGLRAIERAQANGSWSALDDVEALIIPDDLAVAFAAAPGTREGFDRLSRTNRRIILHRIATAKRPETRAGRIAAAVAAIVEGRPPGRV